MPELDPQLRLSAFPLQFTDASSIHLTVMARLPMAWFASSLEIVEILHLFMFTLQSWPTPFADIFLLVESLDYFHVRIMLPTEPVYSDHCLTSLHRHYCAGPSYIH